MYRVEYSRKFTKILDKLPDVLVLRFDRARRKLQENPYRLDLDVKKLRGQKNSYRLRIGDYRFLYKIEKGVLLIFMFYAGHRKDIYK